MNLEYQTFPLSSQLRIIIEEPAVPFTLSESENRCVEDVWEAEMQLKHGNLFNGQLLCYSKHTEDCLYGYFTDYKHYIAFLRNPYLRSLIQICPLGISAMTISGSRILLGKRGAYVTQYPGYYECAPSGGLSKEMVNGNEIRFSKPFEEELYEETGIDQKSIQAVTPKYLILDAKSSSYEIIASMELSQSVGELTLNPTDEYETLIWVDIHHLSEFINDRSINILPLSQYLLRRSF